MSSGSSQSLGKKLLSSLVVRQQILLHLLPGEQTLAAYLLSYTVTAALCKAAAAAAELEAQAAYCQHRCVSAPQTHLS